MSKHTITITDENLYNEIVEFCRLNNEKIGNFCQELIKKQFLIEKYGDTPFLKNKIPKSEPSKIETQKLTSFQIEKVKEDNEKEIEEIKIEKKSKIRRL